MAEARDRVPEFIMPEGATLFIGAPSEPAISAEAVRLLAAAVTATPGVTEAHLPQVFIPTVSEAPRQILVLALAPGSDPAIVMNVLAPRIRAVVPDDTYLDVWPVGSDHPILIPVRNAGCQIVGKPNASLRSRARPWWKLW